MGSIVSSALGGEAAAAESTDGESSGPSRVLEFHNTQDWQHHHNSCKQSNKLMVVDFSATWCGPCKIMEPIFKGMSAKYPDVDFVKIDVDKLYDVAREFGVEAMPTFVLLKQGKVLDRITGAKKDELETKILKHKEVPKFAA